MARNKTSKEAIERAEQRDKVLNLRLKGATIREIAEVLKLSKSTVHRHIQDGIADIPREAAEQLRDLELDRLDRLFRTYWTPAVGGDVTAGHFLLKVMGERAKLAHLHDIAPETTDDGAGKALDDLMDAINGSVVDADAIARAAVAPGAVLESVTGPTSNNSVEPSGEDT